MLAALRSADLSPTDWLTPGDLALILRSAYDPAVAGALERHGAVGRDLATAGPVAVTEFWGRDRSDSAHHCILWISEWPRSLVFPGFLAPLLLSSGIRRTFSLLYPPMRIDRPPARALGNGVGVLYWVSVHPLRHSLRRTWAPIRARQTTYSLSGVSRVEARVCRVVYLALRWVTQVSSRRAHPTT